MYQVRLSVLMALCFLETSLLAFLLTVPGEIKLPVPPIMPSAPVAVPRPKPTPQKPLPHASVPYVPRLASVNLEEDRTEPIKGIRKAMTKAMTKSLNIPHFGYSDEVDITELMDTRKFLKLAAEQRGVRFSYMPFFLKVL